jgi:hypothetical protein
LDRTFIVFVFHFSFCKESITGSFELFSIYSVVPSNPTIIKVYVLLQVTLDWISDSELYSSDGGEYDYDDEDCDDCDSESEYEQCGNSNCCGNGYKPNSK